MNGVHFKSEDNRAKGDGKKSEIETLINKGFGILICSAIQPKGIDMFPQTNELKWYPCYRPKPCGKCGFDITKSFEII